MHMYIALYKPLAYLKYMQFFSYIAMHECFHHVAEPVPRDDEDKSNILRIILIIIGCALAVAITVIIGM